MKNRLANTFLAQTLLISHLVGSNVYAQIPVAPHSQTNVLQIDEDKKDDKAFSLDLAAEYSQKIAVEEQGARENSTDFTFSPAYKINSILTLRAKTIVTKENSGARQTTLSNTVGTLTIKGLKLNENFLTLHSISATAPTNEESKKRDRLMGAAGLTNGIRFKSAVVKVDYKLSLSKNFHEFNINADGSPNVEYRLGHTLDVTVPITDKFSIEAVGLYRFGRTYGGFQRNTFTFDADINYDVTEKLTLNLGTSNDGNALKANGVDSNIDAYNENTSVVRAGISLTL